MELALGRKEALGIPVMVASAGIIVANLYYNQPILHNIAQSIHASESSIGKMSMMAQLGYGLGMLFLVPLGDKMN
ncbi:MAG: hypothetical protein JO154_13830 [Chitinophaga sp.]|uniref:hypothetical protein n=1 Tax=Chitinophaga sp. TaxID=1869181 RepID=UPI0025B90CE3|nr:hypothetical protein [Chitinophaga sp.]MBV8253683.1 hypothetical protein [Chitinophaga sp.]